MTINDGKLLIEIFSLNNEFSYGKPVIYSFDNKIKSFYFKELILDLKDIELD